MPSTSGAHGVVVLVSGGPDAAEKWAAVQSWVEALLARNSELGLEEDMLQLAVADVARGEESHIEADAREDRERWCLQRGFEYIEANLSLDPEAGLETARNEFSEQIGAARVHEALASHAWPVRDFEVEREEVPAVPESGSINGNSNGNGAGLDFFANLEDVNDLLPADPAALDAALGLTPDASIPEMNSPEVVMAQLQQRLAGLGPDNFEETFDMLRGLRDMTTSLPSDQVRDIAEMVAMSFFDAMSDGEGEDGEES